jgi:hypothetical protein
LITPLSTLRHCTRPLSGTMTGPSWSGGRWSNRSSLNIQGAFRHVLTDLYGFIGTFAAGSSAVAYANHELAPTEHPRGGVGTTPAMPDAVLAPG